MSFLRILVTRTHKIVHSTADILNIVMSEIERWFIIENCESFEIT